MAAKRLKAEAKCLICKTRSVHSRGACQSCLRDAYELIRLGQTTEDKLESQRLLLPKDKPGRKIATSPLLMKLAKRK